jgi:hypothetical protein
MFLSILILILLLPFTFLSLALDTFFSSDELIEMGISIGNPEDVPFLPITIDPPKAYCAENTCQLWNATEQAMG